MREGDEGRGEGLILKGRVGGRWFMRIKRGKGLGRS